MSESKLQMDSAEMLLASLNIEAPKPTTPKEQPKQDFSKELEESSYHDFDLAEFPWAVFSRSDRPKENGPILYTDTIQHPETKETVERKFETLPGPFGHATGSTYELAYLLIQMYLEQGACDDKVVVGSLRNLARELGILPTGPNLKRIKRDMDILGTMSIRSTNAYWCSKHQAYKSINNWRFFGASNHFSKRPTFSHQEELPFGYIEVSHTLQEIAKSRGFFALGFQREYFFALKPHEQRLAVFLARRFRYQNYVTLNFEAVVKAIPLTSTRDIDKRIKLKQIAEGLLKKQFPLLGGYKLEKKRGKWIVHFYRKQKPTPEKPIKAYQAEMSLTDEEDTLLIEMIKLTDDPEARFWWLHCIRVLGEASIWRAIGNFKELYIQDKQPIRKNKAAAFYGILKGFAEERNLSLKKQ